MATKIKGKRAYLTILYRDEPGEAAIESHSLGHDTSSLNSVLITGRLTAGETHWPMWSGEIIEGWEVPWVPEPGVNLTEFEEEDGGRHWTFGPDWFELQ